MPHVQLHHLYELSQLVVGMKQTFGGANMAYHLTTLVQVQAPVQALKEVFHLMKKITTFF